jgi:DNA polymerase III alpha subunit
MEQNKLLIPIFKTHYSIGKSILTLEEKTSKEGADSVIQIAKDEGLKKVIFVEDQMHGFLKCKKVFESNNLEFVFGLRVDICDSYSQKETYKVVIFAKNDEGIKKLYKIYTEIHCEHENKITLKDLRKHWCGNSLLLYHPFYDSYLHRNCFSFSSFVPDFEGFGQVGYFKESNGLPIDNILGRKVDQAAKGNILNVQSIYYKNKEDFKAYQTFKIVANRKGGRTTNIGRPELEGCGSDQFCLESWKEKCKLS